MTADQLVYLEDGELLALMAGAMALPNRTAEDCELLDACGRVFRSRKEPGGPDEWDLCRCGLPAALHDPVDGACPNDGDAEINAVDALGPDEWERVRPFIFGHEAA